VQVLLPDGRYAFALLFAGNSALADTAALVDGLAGRPPTGPRGTALTAAVLGLLAAASCRGARSSSPGWGGGVAGPFDRPACAPVPGWLLVPAVLPLLPALVEAVADRPFTLWQHTWPGGRGRHRSRHRPPGRHRRRVPAAVRRSGPRPCGRQNSEMAALSVADGRMMSSAFPVSNR